MLRVSSDEFGGEGPLNQWGNPVRPLWSLGFAGAPSSTAAQSPSEGIQPLVRHREQQQGVEGQ
jgi:hypothetical protein